MIFPGKWMVKIVDMKSSSKAVQTKSKIKQTFMDLLRQKKLEDITVTDICKEACITRGTFYYYYQSAVSLMDELKNELAQEIIAVIKLRFKDGDWNILPIIFEILKKNDPEIVRVTLNKTNGYQCVGRIFASLKEAVRPTLMYKIDTLNGESFDYLYSYITSGISGVLILWVEKGMNPETRVIEKSMIKMINRSQQQMANEIPELNTFKQKIGLDSSSK